MTLTQEDAHLVCYWCYTLAPGIRTRRCPRIRVLWPSAEGHRNGCLWGLLAGGWLRLKNRVASKLRGAEVQTMDKLRGYSVFRG